MKNKGCKFEMMEIVWAKVTGYPWWPGIITQIEFNQIDKSEDIKFVVHFYGYNQQQLTLTSSYLKQKKIAKWEQKYHQYSQEAKTKKRLRRSVELANEELQRSSLTLAGKKQNLPCNKNGKKQQIRQQPKTKLSAKKKIKPNQSDNEINQEIYPEQKIKKIHKFNLLNSNKANGITNIHKIIQTDLMQEKGIQFYRLKKPINQSINIKIINTIKKQLAKENPDSNRIIEVLDKCEIGTANVVRFLELGIVDLLKDSFEGEQILFKLRNLLFEKYFGQEQSSKKITISQCKEQKEKYYIIKKKCIKKIYKYLHYNYKLNKNQKFNIAINLEKKINKEDPLFGTQYKKRILQLLIKLNKKNISLIQLEKYSFYQE